MDHIQDRMTEGSIAGKLVRFAVPLFIGNLFQQLYNTADALIVGNMLGNDALAAVSSTGTLVFLLVSFLRASPRARASRYRATTARASTTRWSLQYTQTSPSTSLRAYC